MNKKDLAKRLLEEIEELFPNAQTELENWDTPFQFLICIILSAQTTDKQVNRVTVELFDKYPTPLELSKADINEVENIIKGINYYKTKARNIINNANIL